MTRNVAELLQEASTLSEADRARTRYGCRRFVLLNYPFDFVYRVRGSEVEIVAIAHHARKPAYWRHR